MNFNQLEIIARGKINYNNVLNIVSSSEESW